MMRIIRISSLWFGREKVSFALTAGEGAAPNEVTYGTKGEQALGGRESVAVELCSHATFGSGRMLFCRSLGALIRSEE